MWTLKRTSLPLLLLLLGVLACALPQITVSDPSANATAVAQTVDFIMMITQNAAQPIDLIASETPTEVPTLTATWTPEPTFTPTQTATLPPTLTFTPTSTPTRLLGSVPVLPPPPSPPPTNTATPSPGFDASFDGADSCNGWYVDILVRNTGSLTFKSVSLTVKDNATAVVRSAMT